MTEVLTFDGKTYRKAVQAAETVGYTPDYVGQLCRGGKVDARLVGRTWYVEETALDDHKRNKTRSNKKKTIESLAGGQEANDEERPAYTEWNGNAAYQTPAYRKRLLETAITYSADTTAPIPELRKQEFERESEYMRTEESEDYAEVPIQLESERYKTKKISESGGEGAENGDVEQHSVPIRTVAERDPGHHRHASRNIALKQRSRRSEIARSSTVTRKQRYRTHPEEDSPTTDTGEEAASSTRTAFTHRVRSAVLDAIPTTMALLSLTLFVMIVLLQHVWVYDTANGTATALETTFNVAAVQSVFEELRP